MGCAYYTLEDGSRCKFNEMSEVACLCTLTEESDLDADTIRSLAYLGLWVALDMYHDGEFTSLPDGLPDKQVRQIKEIVPDGSA